MYKNKINKCLNNCQVVYSSIDNNSNFSRNIDDRVEEIEMSEIKYDNVSIDKKIDDIFNAKDYVYKANVVIVTDSGSMNKTIVARNRNNLITMESEYIPISIIRDIYK